MARNYLEPVDQGKGIYRISWAEAPEPYGLNVVRLVPTADAAEIVVDFQGYHDPAMYSDWRACIVAVYGDGRARYSDLWNKGTMAMSRREGDLRYWLTVAATPRAMLDGGRHTRASFNGPYAARYPWRATFSGAVQAVRNVPVHPLGSGEYSLPPTLHPLPVLPPSPVL